MGLLLAACASTPEQPPFEPPAWTATTLHYAGTQAKSRIVLVGFLVLNTADPVLLS